MNIKIVEHVEKIGEYEVTKRTTVIKENNMKEQDKKIIGEYNDEIDMIFADIKKIKSKISRAKKKNDAEEVHELEMDLNDLELNLDELCMLKLEILDANNIETEDEI